MAKSRIFGSQFGILAGALALCWGAAFAASDARPVVLNEPVDISPDFHDFHNSYFTTGRMAGFDVATASGRVTWQRSAYGTSYSFNNMTMPLGGARGNEFPARVYAVSPSLPFDVDFISDRTVRLRMKTAEEATSATENAEELMLAGPAGTSNAWKYNKIQTGHQYVGPNGSVTISENPWRIEFRDAKGKLLTRTYNSGDDRSYAPFPPFSFVRRASDYSRSVDAVFSLMPGEKIFGCGESFGPLNKAGQKIVLSTTDGQGVNTGRMYKPIPFFMSDRGYGMFMHTSSPITCDFGVVHNDATSLMIGDDALDLFVFFGTPKEILGAYTDLTGKSPMPPLWSFGLWMSRITYSSEQQVREVAAKLRENKIPADVIHLDTGWFENDWQCDYEFSKTRFADPAKMISDLKAMGLHISLWQLPYFVPQNKLFKEIVEKKLYVRDEKGNLPGEDAILDFSNPETVKWYQGHLETLLKMGVGAIKVDFGEAAPIHGIYASGRTGFYEHNLYPLRYNKAVAEITKQATGENIIWARSAWAGSQRYPIHWGGDAASDDSGMAATLRGGLSLGLCGFSFWSHDIGGFTRKPAEELYRRWLPFGMLTSQSRCHGQPPREPWEFSAGFLEDFRKADDLKYTLMPYVYAQAKDSSEHGLPMTRALFVEYPDDPGAWQVEDEYLFGRDILVAPLLHEGESGREVYLPSGAEGGANWIDYQNGRSYAAGWQTIAADEIPIVMLVRDGAAIPRIALAQSTQAMDWSKLELVPFAKDATEAKGLVCLPSDNRLLSVQLGKQDGAFKLVSDPEGGKVGWTITPPVAQ